MKRFFVLTICMLFVLVVACFQYHVSASHLTDCSGKRQAWIDAVDDVTTARWQMAAAAAGLATAIATKKVGLIATATLINIAAINNHQNMVSRRDRKWGEYQDCITDNSNNCPGKCCDSYNGFCSCVIDAGFQGNFRCECFPPGSGS